MKYEVSVGKLQPGLFRHLICKNIYCSASEYNISAIVLGCHRLVEETLSVCDLGH